MPYFFLSSCSSRVSILFIFVMYLTVSCLRVLDKFPLCCKYFKLFLCTLPLLFVVSFFPRFLQTCFFSFWWFHVFQVFHVPYAWHAFGIFQPRVFHVIHAFFKCSYGFLILTRFWISGFLCFYVICVFMFTFSYALFFSYFSCF